MQIEVRIDDSCSEPKVIILTASMTEEVSDLVQKLSESNPRIISGSRNGRVEILEPNDLFKIYAGSGRVFAATDNGEYNLRLRLYEIEERLNPSQFVRISNSEIINLKKVKSFDLSFTGTICVEMTNGTKTYVSRRYVTKVKKYWEYEEADMKKKIFLRSISGFPLGVTIGYLISIVISLIWANGYYAPCVPELAQTMGNEINAVLVQTLLCGIFGMGCAAGSVVWEIEDWGVIKQTGVYFVIVSVIAMPVAYVTFWMEHSLKGFLSYFGTFTLIFAIIWVILYISGRHNVRKMNEALRRKRDL